MLSKMNKNQEHSMNSIWQRNFSDAREIGINLDKILNGPFQSLLDVLNDFKILNDTDPAGLFLSLCSCIGYFSGDSTVKITNHISNLNTFLLLIGPSGLKRELIKKGTI